MSRGMSTYKLENGCQLTTANNIFQPFPNTNKGHQTVTD